MSEGKKQPGPPKWSDDENALIKAEWDRGTSASVISEKLKEKFGTDRSRNAVIGRVHRVADIHGRPNRIPRVTVVQKAQPKRKRAAGHPNYIPGSHRGGPIEPQPVDYPTAQVWDGKPVTLMDLTNETCRWPLEGAGEHTLFCGSPTANLSNAQPYCNAHHRRAFQLPHNQIRNIGRLTNG